MKSGKTREIINRVDRMTYQRQDGHLLVKPDVDVRTTAVHSRFGQLEYECTVITAEDPGEILKHLKNSHELVIIDEAQFFSKELVDLVRQLMELGKHVIVAGLDLDFRGEPFGPMGELLAMADKVHKLTAICDHKDCTRSANRTQRLIDGKPAPYDSPTVLIEGTANEKYECRCVLHHEVPDR